MTQTNQQYVVFAIHRSFYGIPIHEVSEIIRMKSIHGIPNAKPGFLGLIHLRDKVIPIVSLHNMLLGMEKTMDSKTRIIVVHRGEQEVGLVVDEVDRVMFLPESCISSPPHLAQNGWMKGVYHHEETIIALLALESLLEALDG